MHVPYCLRAFLPWSPLSTQQIFIKCIWRARCYRSAGEQDRWVASPRTLSPSGAATQRAANPLMTRWWTRGEMNRRCDWVWLTARCLRPGGRGCLLRGGPLIAAIWVMTRTSDAESWGPVFQAHGAAGAGARVTRNWFGVFQQERSGHWLSKWEKTSEGREISRTRDKNTAIYWCERLRCLTPNPCKHFEEIVINFSKWLRGSSER